MSFVGPVASLHITEYGFMEHLDLAGAHTNVTDRHLESLEYIESIEIPWLDGSRVTDAAIPTIASFNGLIAEDFRALSSRRTVMRTCNEAPQI